MLNLERVKEILSDGQSLSFYGLAERLVGSRSLSDFVYIQLVAQQLERELPAVEWVSVDSGLVSMGRTGRLDEWNRRKMKSR